MLLELSVSLVRSQVGVRRVQRLAHHTPPSRMQQAALSSRQDQAVAAVKMDMPVVQVWDRSFHVRLGIADKSES